MNSNNNGKDPESLEKNGHVSTEEKQLQEDSNKQILSEKVYVVRNSLLTDLMDVKHLQSMYNVIVASCCLLFLYTVIFYLAVTDKFWKDVLNLWQEVQKMYYVVVISLLFRLFAYSVFGAFNLWIIIRNNIHAKVADVIFIILYIGVIIFLFTATSYSMLTYRMLPIASTVTVLEQMVIFLKIHSFVRENVPRVLEYKQQNDTSQRRVLCPSTRQFLYYLFTPVLIYKDSYPQTEKINIKHAFINLFKLVSAIFITYLSITWVYLDYFKKIGLQQFGRQEALLIFAASMTMGVISLFVMFYGILHCWLNFIAELTRFGDKQFYKDWWNSTTFSQYFRRWNVVVHDWIYAYIYQDIQRGMGFNRWVTSALVMFISALLHEYMISLVFGFFYPVLTVMYSTFGAWLYFFTKNRTSNAWNIFMWLMLFSGVGILLCFYTSEYFARINCSKNETSSLDFFIPRSWDSSCHIFDFS